MQLYETLTFSSVVSSALFLFGSIKLNHSQPTTGHKLLIGGFAILTLTRILFLAQVLEIISDPLRISSSTGSIDMQWLYWGQYTLQLTANSIITVGLILSARKLYQTMKPRFLPIHDN